MDHRENKPADKTLSRIIDQDDPRILVRPTEGEGINSDEDSHKANWRCGLPISYQPARVSEMQLQSGNPDNQPHLT